MAQGEEWVRRCRPDMNHKGYKGGSNLQCAGQRDNICILSEQACGGFGGRQYDRCLHKSANSPLMAGAAVVPVRSGGVRSGSILAAR